MFGVEWWLGKVRCVLCLVRRLQFLLATCGGLTSLFSIESFEGFFQTYPRYFEGIPLGYKELVFDISFDATRDVAKSRMKCLS